MAALQIPGNPVADAVHAHAGRVVPTAREVRIDRLAILACVVRHAIAVDLFGRHAHQGPLLQARHSARVVADGLVANEELVVALVVHIHAHLELHDAPGHVCPLRRLHGGHIVVAAGPLVPIPTNALPVAAMRACSAAAAVDTVPGRRLHEVAVARAPRQPHARQHGHTGDQKA